MPCSKGLGLLDTILPLFKCPGQHDSTGQLFSYCQLNWTWIGVYLFGIQLLNGLECKYFCRQGIAFPYLMKSITLVWYPWNSKQPSLSSVGLFYYPQARLLTHFKNGLLWPLFFSPILTIRPSVPPCWSVLLPSSSSSWSQSSPIQTSTRTSWRCCWALPLVACWEMPSYTSSLTPWVSVSITQLLEVKGGHFPLNYCYGRFLN